MVAAFMLVLLVTVASVQAGDDHQGTGARVVVDRLGGSYAYTIDETYGKRTPAVILSPGNQRHPATIVQHAPALVNQPALQHAPSLNYLPLRYPTVPQLALNPAVPLAHDGRVPFVNQGLIPFGNQGLIPFDNQGFLPYGNQGYFPFSNQGYLPLAGSPNIAHFSNQGYLPLAGSPNIAPFSNQGYLPFAGSPNIAHFSNQGYLPLAESHNIAPFASPLAQFPLRHSYPISAPLAVTHGVATAPFGVYPGLAPGLTGGIATAPLVTSGTHGTTTVGHK